jgi:hypothetical protein
MRKFSKVKAVKQKARETIGAPKPTRVRSHRKGGAARGALDPALNRGDLAANPHAHTREDFIEGAPRLSTPEGLHIKQPITLKKPREGPRPRAECLQYSPEIIEHLNILRKTAANAAAAQKAVDEYLAQHREKTRMHSQIAETLTRSHEAPVPVDGSLTAALKDAELKVGFYESEIKRCEAEAERWRQIAFNLKTAIKLTVGEVAMPKPGTGERRERGYWEEKFRTILNRKREPIAKAAFYKICRDEEKCESQPVYMATRNAITKGSLVEIDGKFALPEWTEPSRG